MIKNNLIFHVYFILYYKLFSLSRYKSSSSCRTKSVICKCNQIYNINQVLSRTLNWNFLNLETKDNLLKTLLNVLYSREFVNFGFWKTNRRAMIFCSKSSLEIFINKTKTENSGQGEFSSCSWEVLHPQQATVLG